MEQRSRTPQTQRRLPEASAIAGTSSWIVCHGGTRDVVGGRVACPTSDKVRVADCLDCRFLQSVAREWRSRSCDPRA